MKKKEGHSKTENLNDFNLQNYLKSRELSTKQKKLLFSLRSRSVNVKTNYKNKFKFNMKCSICQLDSTEESEKHLLQCSEIVKKIDTEINLIDGIEVYPAPEFV